MRSHLRIGPQCRMHSVVWFAARILKTSVTLFRMGLWPTGSRMLPGDRGCEYRDLRVGQRIERVVEGEIGHEEIAALEDKAGREVQRRSASPAIRRDACTGWGDHRDLVGLVGTDEEVAADVELDSVGAVDPGREDRDRTGGTIRVHSDPQDAVVAGVRDVQAGLVAIEGDAVRPERGEARGR